MIRKSAEPLVANFNERCWTEGIVLGFPRTFCRNDAAFLQDSQMARDAGPRGISKVHRDLSREQRSLIAE
jgi:hypothetical protein